MVFPKVFYYHGSLFRGTSGVALDLVTPTDDTGMEDRPYRRDPCSQLDLIPNHDRIYSRAQGVLQDLKGFEIIGCKPPVIKKFFMQW